MDGRTAWIVLFECFGFETVKGIKPSTLTPSQIGDVDDLLAGVIEAYRGDNLIRSALSFHSYTPPGLTGVALKGAKAAISSGEAAKYESVTKLPFYNAKFHEWMEKPSFTRGIKMRECMQQFQSDPPSGWNDETAVAAVNRNIGRGGTTLIGRMLGIPGM
jgi:hypothetical protein